MRRFRSSDPAKTSPSNFMLLFAVARQAAADAAPRGICRVFRPRDCFFPRQGHAQSACRRFRSFSGERQSALPFFVFLARAAEPFFPSRAHAGSFSNSQLAAWLAAQDFAFGTFTFSFVGLSLSGVSFPTLRRSTAIFAFHQIEYSRVE